jgi:hypothetical protein
VIVQSSVTTNAWTVVSASASVSCAAGKTMLSGGGMLTTTDTADSVQLIASYPSAVGTWTVTGSASVKNGKTWTIQAYALCA